MSEKGHFSPLHAANAVFDGVGMIIAVAVRHRQPIVDERHVEFAGFENSRDLLVVPPTSNRRAIPDDAHELGGLVQFCACRKPTIAICRVMLFSLSVGLLGETQLTRDLVFGRK